ncbi:MAG: ParB N-terminal domain-containing protein [Betaproteobacteria bacterium]|nr:ParB N-terminal domain-containing protein [Betaproteobacteria bacterium]
MSGKVSLDERRRLVAESLQVGNPGNNARDLAGQGDPRTESQIELSIDEIRPYENNPRRAANAKFEDIKESIRTSGLRSPLTVTRRPGESHFIVEAGGNTRLLALRQLWAETRDPRFRKLVVLFRPWRSESHVLTAHLIENEQRGEMTFWDKACGIVALKSRLEAEQGRTLTLRPLEDALHALGLAVNTATLGLHLFATERLRTLGEAVADLSGLDVKTIQPRLNALKRYAQARTSITEDELYAQVFEPVFRRFAEQYPHTGAFSVAATCEACEVALARHLGEPVDGLREALKPGAGRGAQANLSAPTTGIADAAGPPIVYGGRRPGRCGARRTADARQALRGRCRPWRRRPSGAAGRRRPARRDRPPTMQPRPERERAWWLARWTPRPARPGHAATGVAGPRIPALARRSR